MCDLVNKGVGMVLVWIAALDEMGKLDSAILELRFSNERQRTLVTIFPTKNDNDNDRAADTLSLSLSISGWRPWLSEMSWRACVRAK